MLDLIGALESAFLTLLDYLSLHVLLCLIPAFFIAGAMAHFIPEDLVVKYLGKGANPRIAYPMATAGGFLLAVCSCTVLPLFVGIWKRGAGIGPAITFLFVAPAINILALTYTGTLIGLDIAFARGFLAIIFAIIIGILMSFFFENENQKTKQIQLTNQEKYSSQNELSQLVMSNKQFLLISGLVVSAILLVVLDNNMIRTLHLADLFGGATYFFQTSLFLFGLTCLLILSYTRFHLILQLFCWLFFILMTGTSQINYIFESLIFNNFEIPSSLLNMVAKLFLSLIVVILMIILVIKKIDSDDIEGWLYETKFFIRSIFPLIIVGVTAAGFIKFFIPPELVASFVGSNSLLANFITVLFGVFMYFPTLLEVPIANIFLELGMAKGPLLAYLLADPELSLQSILVTRKYLGDRRNLTFIGLVILFTVLAGMFFGIILGQGLSLW
jgi:uncharacterized membrane protein YraQ (UPF0718 family)